jgi:hypothetical protein
MGNRINRIETIGNFICDFSKQNDVMVCDSVELYACSFAS